MFITKDNNTYLTGRCPVYNKTHFVIILFMPLRASLMLHSRSQHARSSTTSPCNWLRHLAARRATSLPQFELFLYGRGDPAARQCEKYSLPSCLPGPGDKNRWEVPLFFFYLSA